MESIAILRVEASRHLLNNNIKLLSIMMLVAYTAAYTAGDCWYDYPLGPQSILFIFLCPANFHFAVVSKKAVAAKGKKALECRGDLLQQM
jgi:hypothetical protein